MPMPHIPDLSRGRYSLTDGVLILKIVYLLELLLRIVLSQRLQRSSGAPRQGLASPNPSPQA
jgi:hypothetical protein